MGDYYAAFAPQKRRRTVWPWVLLAVIFLMVSVCAVGAKALSVVNVDPTAAASRDVQAEATQKADPNLIRPGTWTVPAEVKPGTYTATAGDDSFGCYWARLKDFDGDGNGILANGNLAAGQHGRLVVKKTDKGLELQGDCVWRRA